MGLTFGSLFAGIGGFDLGFERCGMQCKWQVEIDDYATRILERHWPDVHRERDIKQCGRHNLERVDVICGGFPCQDISYAGKGAGLDGERSGLFFEAIRLVRELRPRAVVLENVAGLLTRGLDRVLGTLAEIGFDAEWHMLPAAAVGAPHIRDRVFVLAYATGVGERPRQGSGCNGKRNIELEGTGPRRNADDCGQAGVLADAKRSKREQRCDVELQRRREKKTKQAGLGCVADDGDDTNSFRRHQMEPEIKRGTAIKRSVSSLDFRTGRIGPTDWWAVEPNVGRVAHGVPARVDRLRCLGNAIVPQVAEVVGRMVLDRLGGE